MDLNENAQIDTSQVEDRRGGGGGGGGGLAGLPIGRGGLVGTLIVVVLTLIGGGVFGVNQLDGGDPGGGSGAGNGDLAARCAADNPDRLTHTDCRNTAFINSIQAYWTGALPQVAGAAYRKAPTVFFDGAVTSGCGAADAGMGPFYCPADHKVYIDLTFWDELANRFGAKGEFAQPYVLAHEYGHHVQSLLGTEAAMRRAQQRDPGNANRLSVALELQADCYAGAWAKNAVGTTDAAGQRIFRSVSQEDIRQALEAAAAVGDDTIARRSGGRIDESKFTHGTAAQRQQWFERGFTGGDPRACDTFSGSLSG